MVRAGRPYYQLQVTIPQEFEEAVSNFLVEAGSSGVKIDQNHASCKIQGYYEGNDLKSTLKRTRIYLESLERLFPERFGFQLSSKKQKNRDWSRSWRESFRPVVLGKKIAIVPAWDKRKASQSLVIKIYPQMAFGTGTHPTTQACLLALHELVKPGDRVLDLGTGSGILAIAAAKMGGRSVVAVDTDPEVAQNARKNFRLNRVEKKIKLSIGRLDKQKNSNHFDLAVANLTGEEILEEIEELKSRVKSEGYIIISGWTKAESGRLFEILRMKELAVVRKMEKKGWATVICKN